MERGKRIKIANIIIGLMIAGFILMLSLIFIYPLITNAIKDKGNDQGGRTNIDNIFKVSPSVDLEETIDGVLINIYAKDDYDYVIVQVSLYDKDKNFIKSFTVRADNLKDGETRQIKHSISLSTHLITRYSQCEILDYK